MDHTAERQEALTAVVDNKPRFPLWVSNLLVFGLLISAVLFYFLWQISQTRRAFLDNANAHAQLVASVIQLNAKGALFSQAVAEKILHTFLVNTARFVDYLDGIEPFSADELTAFSEELHLTGIKLFRPDSETIEGPRNWSAGSLFACQADSRLTHWQEKHLYLFSWPGKETDGCVVIGVAAGNIESLQKQLGLQRFCDTLSALPGISYVEMKDFVTNTRQSQPGPSVAIIEKKGSYVAEALIFPEGRELAIGLNADRLMATLNRLWLDFIIFGTCLALLGAFFSVVLFRWQSFHLSQARAYEKQLSLERENASLGRAAATIAHDVRNPLNALGMGLQRLQIEADEILPEHRHLLSLMLDAVRRTNGIVCSLLNYTRPHVPEKKEMRLDRIVEDTLDLYMTRCKECGISIEKKIQFSRSISGDPDLLGQVMENLIKNAIEAQPDGGCISLELTPGDDEVWLAIRNCGFGLSPENAESILEPYFTTKAEGTGLGLSIAQRIVQAHNGRMQVRCPAEGIIEIGICLPLNQ